MLVSACTGGAELYEAAVLLKEVLRGRGILLIEERTDIVGAAEADGVVLSRQGDTLSACCGAEVLICSTMCLHRARQACKVAWHTAWTASINEV